MPFARRCSNLAVVTLVMALIVGCSEAPVATTNTAARAGTEADQTGSEIESTRPTESVVESSTELNATEPKEEGLKVSESGMQKATFGAGCYWCTEAVFQRLKGVDGVVSGFMGGEVENPSYEAVCQGITGHAEVIHFDYDPEVISFKELLEVFWSTHDPTTLNQQGADRGTQYRSVVYYHNEEQQKLAEQYKEELNSENVFGKPVVTEISAASVFYAAKAGHQNYYNDNPNQGYCGYVIKPKVDKLKKVFAEKLKKTD